jgi:hypothetical protein
MSQMPPQQSTGFEQTSPVWMHHPGVSAQVPPLQYFEQHSSLPPQALPAVLHDPFIGWHVPFVHAPLQHAPPAPHGWPSEMQLVPHAPLLQLSEQQSVFAAQTPPAATHRPMVDAHVPFASHAAEQH